MGIQYRINPQQPFPQSLLAQIRTGIYQYDFAVIKLNHTGTTRSMVSFVCGFAGITLAANHWGAST